MFEGVSALVEGSGDRMESDEVIAKLWVIFVLDATLWNPYLRFGPSPGVSFKVCLFHHR